MDDILIVGAGPVGLFLAIELVRHGARPRLVERRTQAAALSRAVVLQPRTLEALSGSGVTAALLERGHRVTRLRFRNGARELDWPLGDLPSAYPFVLTLAQNETEALLEHRARELGILVERGVELVHLQAGAREQVILHHHRDGAEELRTFQWVVGCDGGASTVRRWSDTVLREREPGVRFVIGDVRGVLPIARDESWLFTNAQGSCAILPMPGGVDRWRVIADAVGDESPEPTLDTLRRLLRERTGLQEPVSSDGWVSWFTVHERVAAGFRRGHVLLAGDAAHTHSPLGGQGMNIGLQDAHNLAWKLALVATHQAGPELLDSYDAERRPVAESVVRLTGRATSLLVARGRLAQGLRDGLAAFLGGVGLVRGAALQHAAELDVSYRRGPLSEQHGRSPGADAAHAGDHVADIEIYQGLRTSHLLRSVRHVLLLFAGPTPSGADLDRLSDLARRVALAHAERVDVHLVVQAGEASVGDAPVLLDPHGALHRLVGAAAGSAFLVRPDGYLAWRCSPIDEARLEARLTRPWARTTGSPS